MARRNLKSSDLFTLDELAGLSPRLMERVLSEMSTEHRQKLTSECEERIQKFTNTCCRVGQACTDPRGISRFPSPYSLMKKHEYLWACLAGYQTVADISAKDEASMRAVSEDPDYPAFIASMKEMLPAGTIIEVRQVRSKASVQVGMKGIVRYVTYCGEVHCRFDNGKYEDLLIHQDSFRIVGKPNERR